MKFKDWFTKNIEEKSSLKDNKINETFQRCDYCNGSGNDPDDVDINCPMCSGTGGVDNDYNNGNWYDDTTNINKPMKKDTSDKKEKNFNVGDVLILTNDKVSSKMPQDAYDFLKTYKTFTVKSINDKGKLNLGCRISKNENGKGVEKIYMFSTDRFDLEKPSTIDNVIEKE